MFKAKDVRLLALSVLVLGAAHACAQDDPGSTAKQTASTPAQPPESTKDVLATVNGAPIGEADVGFALSSGGHKKHLPSEHRKNILKVIIRRELIRQKAVELGLDANPRYQEKLRRMEAQINAFKRKELSELFWREITGRAVVSEAEAKRYFAENTARIRTELHVWQILRRKEGLIEQALKDLEQGASFEDVARQQFPKLPKAAGEPWNLGYLRWKQVPEAWLSVVYDLKKGEVSGVIRGPNKRFWIIKLLDKRENPDINFESIKQTIMEVLKNTQVEKLRAKAERDLRDKASIVHLRAPAEWSGEEE